MTQKLVKRMKKPVIKPRKKVVAPLVGTDNVKVSPRLIVGLLESWRPVDRERGLEAISGNLEALRYVVMHSEHGDLRDVAKKRLEEEKERVEGALTKIISKKGWDLLKKQKFITDFFREYNLNICSPFVRGSSIELERILSEQE